MSFREFVGLYVLIMLCIVEVGFLFGLGLLCAGIT